MKTIFSMFIVMATFFCGSLSAEQTVHYDYDLNQEKMIVDRGEIFLISSFKDQDAITVYNFNGQRLWDVKFSAKIVSWSVQPDLVLVFSKDRNGTSTYLTCLNRVTGRCYWERP